MVSAVQAGQQVSAYQQSSAVSNQSSQPSANLPQDTVTLSEKMQEAQGGFKGNVKGGPADVDHDGDNH
jgi:guanyl-specific ribonuclease Sa